MTKQEIDRVECAIRHIQSSLYVAPWACDIAVEAMKKQIQTVAKKGRWIDMDDHVMCSCCGATHYGADKNYCPNCGADMREGEQDG